MKKEYCFLSVFIIILILPLLFSDKTGGSISEDENRYLASFPQLNLHSGLTDELEDWINDNAGGRETLRTLYNHININLLHTLRDDTNVYIGDWVFMANEDVIRFLQHTNAFDKAQQADFIESYRTVQEALSRKGIHFSALVFPHKSELYAEMLQDYILPVAEHSQLEILENISQNYPELNFTVLYDEFMTLKEAGASLYYKAYDTSHWNNQGAFLGYKALMESVKKEIPSIRILEEADLNIQEISLSKNYNSRIYSETDLDYQVTSPQAVMDNSWFDTIDYPSNDPWKSYRYYRNTDQSLPKILIVGDSYVWMFMMPWIAESFSEAAYIYGADYDNVSLMVDTLQPDMVVYAALEDTVTNIVFRTADAFN